uniref:VIT domain-containing protein n=1 Tax=Cairina moschata TaxID=8855 RepID=A0A8C3C944_CAIMO
YPHRCSSFLLGKDLRIPLCPVPLCSAVVDVAIQDYVADVASELIYQNKSRSSSEVIFVFPLAPHMTIYSFQALNEDAKVQALLQDEVPAFRKEWGETPEGHGMSRPWSHSGEVFACFLGSLSPGKEMVVTLRYVQELPRKLGGAAQFLLPATLHPHWNYYSEDCVIVSTMFLPAAWNCLNNKPHYSLLLTASLQSPRGVVNAEANCALTPLIYTAQDHSAAQVWPPEGSLLGDPLVLVTLSPSIPDAVPGQCQSGEFIFLLDTTFLERAQVPPQSRDQTRESLLFLLKSLPLGCYFNIYCYGATSLGKPSGTPHIPVLSKEFRQRGRMLNSNGAAKVWCLALSTQVLNCLKRALKPAAEGVSLSWTLPFGLQAEVLGGTPRSIFQGEHIHLYAKICGEAQVRAATMGISSYFLITFSHFFPTAPKPPPPSIYSLEYVDPKFVLSSQIFGPWVSKAIDECQELVALQNVDGSWTLSSSLASALQVDEAEIKGKMPGEVTEPSIWATVLAVTWLQKKNRYYQDLCELLEAKAVTWLCSRAGESCFPDLHRIASSLLSPLFSFIFISL